MVRGRGHTNVRGGTTRGRAGRAGDGSLETPEAPQAVDIPVVPLNPTQVLEDHRPQRARRPPGRFRGSRREDEGEEFDINNHSDVSEEEEEPPTGDRRHPTRTTMTDPVVGLATDTSQSTLTDPLATRGSKRAQDILFFYDKNQEGTFCRFCP